MAVAGVRGGRHPAPSLTKRTFSIKIFAASRSFHSNTTSSLWTSTTRDSSRVLAAALQQFCRWPWSASTRLPLAVTCSLHSGSLSAVSRSSHHTLRLHRNATCSLSLLGVPGRSAAEGALRRCLVPHRLMPCYEDMQPQVANTRLCRQRVTTSSLLPPWSSSWTSVSVTVACSDVSLHQHSGTYLHVSDWTMIYPYFGVKKIEEPLTHRGSLASGLASAIHHRGSTCQFFSPFLRIDS